MTYRTSPIRRRRSHQGMQGIRDVIVDVLGQDPPMTVRQVFYQLSTRGVVDKTESEYKGTVCRLLAEMRLDGTIPFRWIADNTRWMRKPRTYDSLEEALRLNLETYRRALWSRMPAYVEVWIEKEALSGVLYDITANWDVPLMVTRGYASLAYLHSAATDIQLLDKPAFIYYLGDYDPSGMDIARSVEARLREFAPGVPLHFERIAVTEEQIARWNLPSRPTKTTDTRAKKFGSDLSVELDAIPPGELRDLVQRCILQHVDRTEFERLQVVEQLERETLEMLIDSVETGYQLDILST